MLKRHRPPAPNLRNLSAARHLTPGGPVRPYLSKTRPDRQAEDRTLGDPLGLTVGRAAS
jgi:hypothetical protein